MSARATPTMEDYLERIHQLMEDKGYARVVDIAERLSVSSPSVTRMVKKLAGAGYLEYERYRGILLTRKGTEVGRRMRRRHRQLEELLRLIGVEDPDTIFRDVEGIEHHVSPETMNAIAHLVEFFKARPDCLEDLEAFRPSPPSG
ncbi:MAG: transcriptional regulator MntR [Planctomycetota bacterium]|jgi:Mn-dependent DtxR family transcriptional regulator